jgi:MoxR-like ATPase
MASKATTSKIGFDLDTVPANDRDRVAALIPDPVVAEQYAHRYIDGFEDFDLLDGAIEDMENVLLAGPTGSSKTTFFRAYAAARGLPFCVVECNAAMDPGVIIGRTSVAHVDGLAVDEFVDGDWTLVVRYGGVGLIDEMNMAHPRITAAYHQLLAVTRRMSLPEAGEVIHAGHGGLGDPQPMLLGAAYNPRYEGTVRLNSALKNRFAMKLAWGYERAVEEQLIVSKRLLDMADNIRSLAEIRSPLSTNMLMEYESHARAYNMAYAKRNLINAFEDGEDGGVKRALEANEAAIAEELGLPFKKSS